MPNGNPVVMHLSCNFVHNAFQCRDTRGVFSCAWDGLQLAYFTYYYLEGVVFIVSRLPPAVDLHAKKRHGKETYSWHTYRMGIGEQVVKVI